MRAMVHEVAHLRQAFKMGCIISVRAAFFGFVSVRAACFGLSQFVNI